MNILKNKNILLCVTGSIAAYKACEILRLLRKEDVNVQVMMSRAAEEFVGVATFAALSNNEVLTNLFPDNPKGGMAHVNLSFDLDAIIVVPATPLAALHEIFAVAGTTIIASRSKERLTWAIPPFGLSGNKFVKTSLFDSAANVATPTNSSAALLIIT
jgi:phosphopantothenoylcysteine decarboxylase/phosphopantothenate--cysteine ligase